MFTQIESIESLAFSFSSPSRHEARGIAVFVLFLLFLRLGQSISASGKFRNSVFQLECIESGEPHDAPFVSSMVMACGPDNILHSNRRQRTRFFCRTLTPMLTSLFHQTLPPHRSTNIRLHGRGPNGTDGHEQYRSQHRLTANEQHGANG